jgi:peptidoglycan/LPS O-acetylase OafA/YrhL
MNRQSVALGGLAIVLVVLHHAIDFEFLWLQNLGFSVAGKPEFYLLAPLHKLGPIAVPLFLFISGGFVAYAARGNPPRLSRHSVQSALLRLLWPYLVWSTVSYLMVYWQNGERYSLAGYLKNYIVGYPYHFVPLLLFFYTISPILAYWAKRYGSAVVVAFALYQIVLVIVKYPAEFGLILPSWAEYLSPPILGYTLAMWGVYFPLGMVVALDGQRWRPWLERCRWPLVVLTLAFFVIDILNMLLPVHIWMAVYIYPLTFVLLAPQIKRQWIPAVGEFEYIGKRSYGVYFTHLLVMNLLFLGVQHWAPWLIESPLLVVSVVFLLAIGIPLLVMHLFSAMPSRMAYRYVFG